jgi:hypothetical protein
MQNMRKQSGGTSQTDLDRKVLIGRKFPRFHWKSVFTGYFLEIGIL